MGLGRNRLLVLSFFITQNGACKMVMNILKITLCTCARDHSSDLCLETTSNHLTSHNRDSELLGKVMIRMGTVFLSPVPKYLSHKGTLMRAIIGVCVVLAFCVWCER